jgi:hypothetical protein
VWSEVVEGIRLCQKDFTCAVVKRYLECVIYSSCVINPLQETDNED